MLTSIRGLTAASFSAGLLLSAAPAFASEPVSESVSSEESLAIANLSDTLIEADAALTEATSTEGEVVLAPSVERASQPIQIEESNAVGEGSGIELSGNVALVTDYRFRGVSFSDGDPALQGGIDLAHSSGLYVGVWGSTISGGTEYGELELDIYGGWSGDLSDGLSFDIGLLYYIYPTESELAELTGTDTDYFEPYASVSTTLGPVGATLGVAYAWEQDSLGGGDNFYIYTDFEAGIPDTPLTLTAHIGYTDGVFATDIDGSSLDWGLGASYAITDALSVGVNYVDTEGPDIEDFTDAGIFFTISYSM